ncbi:MAG: hypothetical protein HY255_11885 [Betaproteobacteria bacterium]|nr:hypothetical protein [Betaproteobacteria bacterium]
MSDSKGTGRVGWAALLALLLVGGGLIWWNVSNGRPQWAWLVSLVSTAFALMAFGYNAVGVWSGIFIDRRNVISLSRMQMVLWTILIVSAILAAGLWNLHVGADALKFAIPEEVWALMGISAASSVGASLILSNKGASAEPDSVQFERQKTLSETSGTPDQKATETTNIVKNGVLVANLKPEMARWSDMVTGDETGNFAHIDLSKVQMLLFTAISVLIYGLALWAVFDLLGTKNFPAFPPFDKTILTLIGISHVGYLSYKASPNSEPANSTK